MATPALQETRVELLDTVQVLHDHLTASLGQTVFQQTRTTERERHWTLHALAEFWTAVILRAPPSLTQALEEAAAGTGGGWPLVQATPEACFQRCQTLHWRFFATLYEAFVAQVVPEASPCDAQPLQPLREHVPEVWVVDGSRLDAVAHRLKRLRDVRAAVLPGCVIACYDLDRGIARRLCFAPDAAAGDLPRAITALEGVPRHTLVVGARAYGVGKCFAALTSRELCGVCRRHACQSWRWVQDLRNARLDGGTLWDSIVELPGKGDLPPQRLRWIRWRKGREVRELLTNVLEPTPLSAEAALALEPWRWKVARVFFDLTEVLNLPRFSVSSPHGVAMQVYAAAVVHTAMRGAQGRVAVAVGIPPEEIAPARFFPRLAAAAIGLTWAEVAFVEIQQANPGRVLQQPNWQEHAFAWTTLEAIRVEPRKGRRKQQRFCRSRAHWKSFTHIPGGKKLT
jgi:hypothetical protein